MVTFRCIRSGNCIHLDNEDDIKQLRVHESYVEVKNEANPDEKHADEKDADEGHGRDAEVKVQEAPKAQVLKKQGRPRKNK